MDPFGFPGQMVGQYRAANTVAPGLLGDWYLKCLGFVLLGYALLNRSFAYLGVAPLFIGELMLMAGGVLLLFNPTIVPLTRMLSFWILILLMIWTSFQTLPYLGEYQFDAIRDAMIVGYGCYALIIAGLVLAKPTRLILILNYYQKFCYLFLLLTPLVRLLVIVVGGVHNLPLVPGASIPIVTLRMGPVMIHLATVTVFLSARRISPFWIGMIAINFLLAVTSRGGSLAFIATIAVTLLLRPTTKLVWQLFGWTLIGLVLLGVTGLKIQLDQEHAHRNISFDMFFEQFTSILGDSKRGSFDDTKEWRIYWWSRIYEYTILGDYLWTGKGFGINLAKDDGIPQAEDDIPLRSPHNSHLTILARGGLPAFVLWLGLNVAWAFGIVFHYSLAIRNRQDRWASLFLFVLAHWVATMVSTSFDVYLEAPMGGIWFWSVFGLGWAASWLHSCFPQLLPEVA